MTSDASNPAAPRVVVRTGLADLRPEDGPLFLVIGVFDGLHRGHLSLIERLVAEARSRGARPAVLTFDSHPDELISGAAPPLLVDPAERVRLLGALGVRVVVVQHFDAALRATEYDAFVASIRARVEVAGLLMTPDAAFGRDRRGTPETLALLAAAERLLGRPYELLGDADGSWVSFALPVALPPSGERVAEVDGHRTLIRIDRAAGRVELERPLGVGRVRIRLGGS